MKINSKLRFQEKLKFAHANLETPFNSEIVNNYFRKHDTKFGEIPKKSFYDRIFKNRFSQPQWKLEIIYSNKFIKKNLNWLEKAQLLNRLDGGLSGNNQWKRLCEIFEICLFFRPSHVIEFGSGIHHTCSQT